jgi:hypothetical protein
MFEQVKKSVICKTGSVLKGLNAQLNIHECRGELKEY